MARSQVCAVLAVMAFLALLPRRYARPEPVTKAEYSCELRTADIHCMWDLSDLSELESADDVMLVKTFEDNATIKYSDMADLTLSLPRNAQPTPIFSRLNQATELKLMPKDPDTKSCWVKRSPSELFPSGWVPSVLDDKFLLLEEIKAVKKTPASTGNNKKQSTVIASGNNKKQSTITSKSREEVMSDLAHKTVMFAGDSTIREIYTELVSLMLNSTDKAVVWPIKDKHADLVVQAKNITAMFYWTPTIQSLYKRMVQISSQISDQDITIAGVGAWHVWHENITEYAATLRKIRLIAPEHMSWIGIPYPVSLPGLRVPNRVRAWNSVTQDILQEYSVKFVDYYGITRTRAHESDGNIHYGYWSKAGPGNCTRAALLVGLDV